jgi:hybrid cluster-associated redox disulfide protein
MFLRKFRQKSKGDKIMAEKVTKDMNILEIAKKHPEAIEVFHRYGLGCLGCAAARYENLEAGAKVHGYDPDEMVADINALIEAVEG